VRIVRQIAVLPVARGSSCDELGNARELERNVESVVRAGELVETFDSDMAAGSTPNACHTGVTRDALWRPLGHK
jgi:hypothetical protein